MPRNPSGEYSLPYNWNDDKADGIKILASRMQGQDQDIADALTRSLPVDGSAPMEADLDMNNYNVVDVADGVNLQDAMTVRQGQSGSLQYFGISSTTPLGIDGEDYEVGTTPTISAYPNFLKFSFVSHFTCLDGPSLRLNTLATKNLVKDNGAGIYTALVAGDMVANAEYQCIYNTDVSSSNIIVTNPETISGSYFDTITTNNIVVNKTTRGAVFSPKIVLSQSNATDPDNDIDVAAGGSFDQTNFVGWGTSAKTKRLDVAWAAGTNQGGLDTGTKASNTFYYIYAIYNPTTNADDILFTATLGSPTLPSGYAYFAYKGAFQTDGSGNIIGFFQNGNEFTLKTPVLDQSATTITTSRSLLTLTVPTGFVVKALMNVRKNGSSSNMYLCSPNATDLAPSETIAPLATIQNVAAVGSGEVSGFGPCAVLTNSSAQIAARCDTNNNIWIATLGWIDYNIS